MRFLPKFNDLPTSLLLASLALSTTALPVSAKTLLTPDTFTELTASGLWFIEFFSPYCGHCTAFAPTWDKLVEELAADTPQVKLAQVDCSMHGDLCTEKQVNSYPTIKMYNKGEEVGKYHGGRDLSDLHKFVNRHAEGIAPPPSAPSPPQKAEDRDSKPQHNTAGELLTLTDSTFAQTLAQGPMFIKFFAPWCGHCKKLAPIWRTLARDMKGKLNVAEVNCDDNPGTCKAYGVQQYPTLIYVTTGGIKSEYMGGRKIEQLRKFAEGASGEGVKSIKSDELVKIVKEQEVVYVLLHSDETIVDVVKRAAAALLGSPVVYAVSDPALLARYSVPQTSTWALLAFKDGDAQVPTSILHERLAPSSGARQEATLRDWALGHRLPTVLELTQDTFQTVMNAPQAPLVVIAAVTGKMKGKVEEKVREIGKKWRVRTGGSGEVKGREVVWTWMDAERWKDWMKSMYGIVVRENVHDLEDVSVVLTDHKRLVYWDKDEDEDRLKITSSKALFAAVEDAVAGKIPYKNSENLVERIARYLNTKMTSLEIYVVTYPWRAAFFIFIFFVAVFLGLRRLVRDDVSQHEYRKVDRLD
ncbi:hypothetical protein H0H87_001858 [Tephrocybe sp. NHM501043]|nr:hypothetical protein H0H87_001858 [Tephrocybe sp. NHM501043]